MEWEKRDRRLVDVGLVDSNFKVHDARKSWNKSTIRVDSSENDDCNRDKTQQDTTPPLPPIAVTQISSEIEREGLRRIARDRACRGVSVTYLTFVVALIPSGAHVRGVGLPGGFARSL